MASPRVSNEKKQVQDATQQLRTDQAFALQIIQTRQRTYLKNIDKLGKFMENYNPSNSSEERALSTKLYDTHLSDLYAHGSCFLLIIDSLASIADKLIPLDDALLPLPLAHHALYNLLKLTVEMAPEENYQKNRNRLLALAEVAKKTDEFLTQCKVGSPEIQQSANQLLRATDIMKKEITEYKKTVALIVTLATTVVSIALIMASFWCPVLIIPGVLLLGLVWGGAIGATIGGCLSSTSLSSLPVPITALNHSVDSLRKLSLFKPNEKNHDQSALLNTSGQTLGLAS